MNHSRSLGRIVLISTFLLAASATTAHCEPWDPLGIQDHHEYMPFGPIRPEAHGQHPQPHEDPQRRQLQQEESHCSPKITLPRRPTESPSAPRPSHATNSSRQSNPSRTTRFDDLNLSVTMPSGPWTKLDPQQTGSRARYLISRGHPTIIISLAGEHVGTEAGATNSDPARRVASEDAQPARRHHPTRRRATNRRRHPRHRLRSHRRPGPVHDALRRSGSPPTMATRTN